MFQISSADFLYGLPDSPRSLTTLVTWMAGKAGEATEGLMGKVEEFMESLVSSFTALMERCSASSGMVDSAVQSFNVRNRSPDQTAIIIVPLILGFVLLMTILNYRRRMAEIRYKTIERLAQDGQLTERQIDEFLGTRSRRTAIFMVLGWLTMFVGIALLALSQINVWYSGALYAGVVLVVLGLGVISTPIMLREMKKQEIL